MDAQLSHVAISDLDDNIQEIEADALLCFYGLASSLGVIEEWGLDLKSKHVLIKQSTAETNRERIFAVGDVATYDHKIKLILTGFAECAQAAHAIYNYIHPDTPLHFEYSTTKGLPA